MPKLRRYRGIRNQETSKTGLTEKDCGSDNGDFLYVDDVSFSGTRIVNDFRDWVADEAPDKSNVVLVFAGIHNSGAYRAKKGVAEVATNAKKEIRQKYLALNWLESYENSGSDVDVFRLRKLPTDDKTKEYVAQLSKPPGIFRGEGKNTSEYFSSEQNRALIENVLWEAGLDVREKCPNLKEMHRPLGYTSKGSKNNFGFGSIVVTYRNCPNSCPLAFWVGDPWQPLFARDNN